MSRWRRWVTLLAAREAPTSLALMRVAVGLVVASSFATMMATDSLLLSQTDVAGGAGYRQLDSDQWLVEALGGPTPEAVTALAWAAMLGGLATALGLGGGASPFLTLQACIALFSIHPATGGGHDRVMTNALWILTLSPAARTLSLDCRLRSRRWRDDTPRPAWPRYALIVQLAALYGATGAQKLGADWFYWGDFRAVYLALLIPAWARWELGAPLGVLYPVTQLATAITWCWELSWPLVLLALWYRHTRLRPGWLRACFNRLGVRTWYVLVGIGMHGTVWVLMELGPFSAITLALYPVVFHPDEWGRWLGRGGGRGDGPVRRG